MKICLTALAILCAFFSASAQIAGVPTPTPTPESSIPGIPPVDASPTPAAAKPLESGTGTIPNSQTAPSGEAKAPRAMIVNEREAITRLQIFLDQNLYGPGKIDGRWGEFTGKVLNRDQRLHGLPVTPKPQKQAWETIGKNLPMETVDPIYTTYEIKPDDLKQVGTVPRVYAEQAKQKSMPYESLLEFVCERFHSDPKLIARLNPKLNMEKLKEGDVLWVPNVEPFKIEDLKEIAKLPKKEEFLSRKIHIYVRPRMLEVEEGDQILAVFPITPGSERLPAPQGTWKILGIAGYPWFRRDEKMLNEGVRSSEFFNIPPGPNSPVGVIWMGLNKPGVGIHGTNSPDTIGRSASHGCIRVANWDVIRLKDMVTEGMTVQID